MQVSKVRAGVFMLCTLLFIEPASANQIGDDLKNFGIIGTWSKDCTKTSKDEEFSRETFWVSFFGNPGKTWVANVLDVGTLIDNHYGRSIQETEYSVDATAKMDDKTIRLTIKETSSKHNGKNDNFPADADKFFRQPINEAFLIEISKIRLIERTNLKGELVIKDGKYRKWVGHSVVI